MTETITADADTELVDAARAGDVEAYAELVRRYQAFAVGLAAVVTRSPADAEDVAQEAFLKAYYALDRFRPGASFRPWLVRIVVNEARNARAVVQRRAVLQTRVGEDAARVTIVASAEDAAMSNQQRDTLLAVLDGLREDDRAVLMYRYVFDLSEAEMAEALACSPGTVKSRLSRALARLRGDLKKTAPLLAALPNLGPLLGQSVPRGATQAAGGPTPDLVSGLAHRLGAGGAPPASSSSNSSGASSGRGGLQHMAVAVAGGVVVAVALAAIGLLLSTSEKRVAPAAPTQAAVSLAVASPAPTPPSAPTSPPAPTTPPALTAPSAVVVFGGDLTDAQRQELSQTFAVDAPFDTDSVSRDELVATLLAAGLPVDGSERAVSSAAVTCLAPGSGLSVRTENVTELPAAAYANALVTAGIVDAAVIVAAPPSTPMTGETALVGVLKAYPRCHPGQPPQTMRLRLAYDELHATADLAQTGGAWDKAAAVMLRGAQVAMTTRSNDDQTLSNAVDAAAAAEGLALNPQQRAELVSVVGRLAGVDYGSYANGYAIQQVGANEVRVTAPGGASQ